MRSSLWALAKTLIFNDAFQRSRERASVSNPKESSPRIDNMGAEGEETQTTQKEKFEKKDSMAGKMAFGGFIALGGAGIMGAIVSTDADSSDADRSAPSSDNASTNNFNIEHPESNRHPSNINGCNRLSEEEFPNSTTARAANINIEDPESNRHPSSTNDRNHLSDAEIPISIVPATNDVIKMRVLHRETAVLLLGFSHIGPLLHFGRQLYTN